MRTIWVILIVVMSMTASVKAQTNSAFDQGNEFYRSGDYRGAIEAWTTILDEGQHSGAVYFNLGNAHYKLNEIGPSIYFYEKALQLDPFNSDISNNLAYARNATVDAIEPLPTSVFTRWYHGVTDLFDYEGWALWVIAWIVGFSVFFLMYYFGRSERLKRLFFVLAFSCLGMGIIALFLAYQVRAEQREDRPAIIFAESSEVLSEPTRNSDLSFVLHEGTKVQILSRDGDWVRVQIADGQDGWMRLSDLKEL